MVNLILRQHIPLNLSRNLSGSSRHGLPVQADTLRALSLHHMLITTTALMVRLGNLHPLRLTPVRIDPRLLITIAICGRLE